MNFLNIPNIPTNLNLSFITQFGLIIKLVFLVADFFIITFIFVIIKQIFSMDHIVHDSNDFMIIKTFSFLLLFIAVSLFLLSLVIL